MPIRALLHVTLSLTLLAACSTPTGVSNRPVERVPRALRAARATTTDAGAAAPLSFDASAALGAPAIAIAVDETSDAAPSDGEVPWATFGAGIGGVITSIDSQVRVGFSGAGVGLDLEELLDVDSTTTRVRGEAFWRFTENKRHRLDLSMLDLDRDGSLVLDRELDVGDGTTIPIGARVDSQLDLKLIKGQYSYSFFQDDRFDLAVTGGLYVLPIDFELEATGNFQFFESLGVTAPLPVFGFRFDFSLTPKWFLRSDLDLFYLEFGDFKGSIASWTAGVEYRVWDHVAIGAGFDSFQLSVERNGSSSLPGVDEAGLVEFSYIGFGLSLNTVW